MGQRLYVHCSSCNSWIAFWSRKERSTKYTKYVLGRNLNRALFTVLSVSLACLSLAERAQAHPAWGMAVDRQGQVYFSDLTTVWKVDAQGRVSVLRAKDDRHTHDLNMDEAGNLYGADNSYEPANKRFFSAIWKMTPAGDISYLLAPTDDPPEGTSIWRDRAGNAYHVAYFPENQLLVLKTTQNGDVSVLVGNKESSRNYRQGVPYSAGGMAFDSDGALYFVHGANVSKISTTGNLTALVRDLATEGASSPTQLFGIAVNAQGIAFVADYGNRRVLKITPDNQLTTFMRAEPPWLPTGVACLGDDLYVLEHSFTAAHAPMGTRVRKLSPGGQIRVLATVGEVKAISEGSPVRGDIFSKIQVGPKLNRYVLIGAATAILTLTFIVWRLSRRMYNRRLGRN